MGLEPVGDAAHSLAPEHDWSAASRRVFPSLRPPGTHGTSLEAFDPVTVAQQASKRHTQPLIDPGPADLKIVYVLRQPRFDVIVDGDHLLAWAISPQALRDTANANLRSWSAGADWSDEVSGDRHLLASETGDGCDAARILLPEVRSHLAGECGGRARVLIGIPDRDLLIAGSLQPGDGEFGGMFAPFVADLSEGAHEPIDGRVFELAAGELVPFVA